MMNATLRNGIEHWSQLQGISTATQLNQYSLKIFSPAEKKNNR